MPYEQILECYSSDVGTQFQLDAEAKTKQLAAPREMLSFVPTIVYNHVRIKCLFNKILSNENRSSGRALPKVNTNFNR